MKDELIYFAKCGFGLDSRDIRREVAKNCEGLKGSR
jgi:hypothetical protein